MAYKKQTGRKPVRRTRRSRRKKSGHSFFYILLIICVIAGAAWMAKDDGFNAAPEGTVAMAETKIHHLSGKNDGSSEEPAKQEETLGEKIKKKLSRAELEQKKEEKSEKSESLWGKLVSAVTSDESSEESSAKSEASENAVSSEKQSTKQESVTVPAVPAPAKPAKPAPKPKQPSGGAKLAVVIDDAGRDMASQRIYEGLGVPFTLAVMPNQVHTRDAASEWAALGYPVILHQPMEPVSRSGMEAKTILTDMSDSEILAMLSESLDQVPEASGINNHQGSKATTDPRVMNLVMKELSRRGLFFFDSHTNTTTAADAAAANYGVRYGLNDLFVDNSASQADIMAMIQEAANRAKSHGSYIIIGHCRPATAAAFREMVPRLQAEGIEFVPLSTLLR